MIDNVNEVKSQKILFEHIDRIINATRIDEMQELKKLVKFIDHLIQTLLHQISGGLLTDKGAKIKILQLFNIIQHCQIGNHPVIKNQLQKLKQCYENKFKSTMDTTWLAFKSKPNILTTHSIQHYVESIQDSQADPIYSEQPKSLIEIATQKPSKERSESINKPKKLTKENEIKVSQYYLSNLIQKKDVQEKLKTIIPKMDTCLENKKKKFRCEQFDQLSQSVPKTIVALA